MIVRLNGTEITSPIDGLTQVKVKHQFRDEDGFLSRSYSESLTFYGQGFEIIRDNLILDPNGKFNQVIIELVDDCCGNNEVVFLGVIGGDSIDWCEGDCFVTIQAVEQTELSKKIDCLNSKLIYDNQNGFQDQDFPRVVYCNELRPSWSHHTLLILGVLTNFMFITMTPLVFAVMTIINSINAIVWLLNIITDTLNGLPGINVPEVPYIDLDGDINTSLIEEYRNFLDQMNEFAIGCGRKHPTPLVRDYINNICEICDLEWSSQILKNSNSEYYNSLFFHHPVEKGTRDDTIKYIIANKPNYTGIDFLNLLEKVFNAEYRFIDSVLTFERKDFFYENENWIDYNTIKNQGRIVNKICYSYRDDDAPAYGNYKYSKDPMDMLGNEAMDLYSDIVEWNQPYTPRQKGHHDLVLPLSPSRYRGDGITPDIMAGYEDALVMGDVIQQFDNVLLLSHDVNFIPKLLIWDGENTLNARIKRYDTPAFEVPFQSNFNYPYLFNKHLVTPITSYNIDMPYRALYGRFHAIDHPKLLIDQGKRFEFSFQYTCEEIQDFDLNKNIGIPLGSGRISNISIDFDRKIITVTGKI